MILAAHARQAGVAAALQGGVQRLVFHRQMQLDGAAHGNDALRDFGSLSYLDKTGSGVAVLLNCGESAAQLLDQFEGKARSAHAPERGRMDLRSYGIGAQILREVGVRKMQLLGQPRRMPSMAGYGLEITGYITKE